MRSAPDETLAELARVLDELGVGWYLFGAQAALIYGVQRLTVDVDVTVHLHDMPPRQLMNILQTAGFTLRIQDPTFIDQTRVVPIVYDKTGVAVDLVLAGPGIEELFLQRAERVNIDDISICVARAEDIITMKILAGRAKDLEDVHAILKARGKTLNLDLIAETLSLLEQALDQSDLSPVFVRALARAGISRR
jgi:predicted nucleotidyltransferase